MIAETKTSKNFASGGFNKTQYLRKSQKRLRNLMINLNTGFVHTDQRAKATSYREESDVEASCKPKVNSSVVRANDVRKFFNTLSNTGLYRLLVSRLQK